MESNLHFPAIKLADGTDGPVFERRTTMEKDVVCGMDVEPGQAAATTQYQGKTYYFCSKECKTRFDANPSQYAR